jgi:hypothetical protein
MSAYLSDHSNVNDGFVTSFVYHGNTGSPFKTALVPEIPKNCTIDDVIIFHLYAYKIYGIK